MLCSKGTYVRVLGEDIAVALGSCGHLVSLRREYVEPFADEPMVTLEQLEAAPAAATGRCCMPIARWRTCRRCGSAAADALALRCGRIVALSAGSQPSLAGRWRLYDEQGGFLGLGLSSSTGELRVQRLFSAPLPL